MPCNDRTVCRFVKQFSCWLLSIIYSFLVSSGCSVLIFKFVHVHIFSLLCYLFVSVFLDSCSFESPIHFYVFIVLLLLRFFFLLIYFFSSTTFFFISFLSCCLFYFSFLYLLPPCIVLLHLLSSGFLLPAHLLSNKIVPSSMCCCVFVSVMKIV